MLVKRLRLIIASSNLFVKINSLKYAPWNLLLEICSLKLTLLNFHFLIFDAYYSLLNTSSLIFASKHSPVDIHLLRVDSPHTYYMSVSLYISLLLNKRSEYPIGECTRNIVKIFKKDQIATIYTNDLLHNGVLLTDLKL